MLAIHALFLSRFPHAGLSAETESSQRLVAANYLNRITDRSNQPYKQGNFAGFKPHQRSPAASVATVEPAGKLRNRSGTPSTLAESVFVGNANIFCIPCAYGPVTVTLRWQPPAGLWVSPGRFRWFRGLRASRPSFCWRVTIKTLWPAHGSPSWSRPRPVCIGTLDWYLCYLH